MGDKMRGGGTGSRAELRSLNLVLNAVSESSRGRQCRALEEGVGKGE